MDQETEFTGEFATGAISKNGEVVARLVSADRDFFDRTVLAVNAHEALVSALNDIASWKEGETVNGSFDEPHSAEKARAALKKAGAL